MLKGHKGLVKLQFFIGFHNNIVLNGCAQVFMSHSYSDDIHNIFTFDDQAG